MQSNGPARNCLLISHGNCHHSSTIFWGIGDPVHASRDDVNHSYQSWQRGHATIPKKWVVSTEAGCEAVLSCYMLRVSRQCRSTVSCETGPRNICTIGIIGFGAPFVMPPMPNTSRWPSKTRETHSSTLLSLSCSRGCLKHVGESIPDCPVP